MFRSHSKVWYVDLRTLIFDPVPSTYFRPPFRIEQHASIKEILMLTYFWMNFIGFVLKKELGTKSYASYTVFIRTCLCLFTCRYCFQVSATWSVQSAKLQRTKMVQLQFVEHSNRRKMQSYSMRRKNSIPAIIFIWLYFVGNNIFVVWRGRFAPFAK